MLIAGNFHDKIKGICSLSRKSADIPFTAEIFSVGSCIQSVEGAVFCLINNTCILLLYSRIGNGIIRISLNRLSCCLFCFGNLIG